MGKSKFLAQKSLTALQSFILYVLSVQMKAEQAVVLAAHQHCVLCLVSGAIYRWRFGFLTEATIYLEGGKALPRLLLAFIRPYVKTEGYLQEGSLFPHHQVANLSQEYEVKERRSEECGETTQQPPHSPVSPPVLLHVHIDDRAFKPSLYLQRPNVFANFLQNRR